MKLVIDISRLSGMTARKLFDSIDKVLSVCAGNLKEDLADWDDPETPAYQEMEGWRQGALDALRDVARQRQEYIKTTT